VSAISTTCRRAALAALVAAAGVLGVCCRNADRTAGPAARLGVCVSITPQKHFVERVGGQRVAVSVLVPPGQSPETYSPSARQLAEMAKADVYFTIGVPFEEQLGREIRSSFPGLNTVDTRKGIELRTMEGEEAEAEEGHEHHHGGLDPHIWMSPRLVKVQARTVCDELKRLDPAHAAEFEDNLRAFHGELDSLDAEIAERLAPVKGRTVFAYHPSLGYFTDAYGLKQWAVEISGKAPAAREVAALVEAARAEGVRVVFTQPEFRPESARIVAEAIGGRVVEVDPLAEDYAANLRRISIAIAGAWQEE